MRSVRFFRVVWRVNALLLLVAGLLGVVLLVAGAVSLIFDISRAKHVVALAPKDEKSTHEDNLRLTETSPSEMMAGSLRLLELHDEPHYSLQVSGKSPGVVRNLLFIDLVTGESHWLAPDNRRLIKDWVILDAQGQSYSRWADKSAKSPAWLLAEIVSEDSNGNGGLDEDDLRQLVLIRLSDWKRWLLTKNIVNGITHRVESTQYIGINQTEQGYRRLVFDLAASRVVLDSPIEVNKP